MADRVMATATARAAVRLDTGTGRSIHARPRPPVMHTGRYDGAMTGRHFVILDGLGTVMATCALTLGLSAAALQQAPTAAGAPAAADELPF